MEKQVAIIYLGTQGILKDVPVKSVKDFEEQFLMEMEAKHADILGEFKKGNLPEDGLKRMTDVAKLIMSQYK